jgi:hypothetical protein
MIEWVPIKEFLNSKIDEDEIFLVLRKNSTSPNIANISSFYREEFLERCTYAAKINLPVEKTLEEKFAEFYRTLSGSDYSIKELLKELSIIAQEHYEEEK